MQNLPAEEDIAALFARAVTLHQGGALTPALEAYRQIVARAPGHFDALHYAGLAQCGLGQYAGALEDLDRALAVNPDSAEAHNSRGVALAALQRFAAAVASYDRAVALKAGYHEAYTNRGAALLGGGDPRAAVLSFEAALKINPGSVAAASNCAVALIELRQYAAALEKSDAALRLAPDHIEALNNRGIALRGLKRLEEAVASFDAALRVKPGFAKAHYNRAITLEDMRQFEAAIASYARARDASPAYGYLTSNILHARMHICDWRGHAAEVAALEQQIARGEKVSPFSVMGLTHSLAVQQRAAANWTASEFPANAALGAIGPHARAAKIRIGYFSTEYRYSAFAVMSSGIFEAHDREKFEITAFSFGPNTGDASRKRLEKAFDRFIDVADKSDIEVAAMARGLGIDIAVDLTGHQREARTGVFALRAAPLQITYLSLPLNADYIDYHVADEAFIPGALRPAYRDKIARLPFLLANDHSRPAPERTFTRAELGLPAAGFVFCCFSAVYKITPLMFAAWMRILGQVPGSVLWLAARHPSAVENLRAQAAAHGIDPARLVFAGYTSAADHLARHAAADLFLDTLPFNAHSTAADALWTGLPVITCAGETMAARGGACLLAGAGLPELVTTSVEAYETLAVALARDPARLAGIKRHLAEKRLTQPLFSIGPYTRNLEKLYGAMIARQDQGLEPVDLNIT